MERSRIIEEIYADDFYRGYINHHRPHLVEEGYSEFLMEICEIPTETLTSLNESGHMKYYGVRIMQHILFNKYSNFNKMYNEKHYNIEDCYGLTYEEDDVKDCHIVKELIDDVYGFLKNRTDNVESAWYDEKLFKMYFGDDETYRSLSDKTEIPYTSIFHNIKGTQEIIKTKFKKRYDDL
tara:strand:+ start:239 stop:778 length:540 start_codon:yes stop_codon:yes gene_type:complete